MTTLTPDNFVSTSEQAALLRAILDSAVDGMIVIDASANIESFNPAASRIFGYSPEEVVGKNVKILMPSSYRDEHDGYIDRYRRTGEKRIIGIGREVVGLRKDGSLVPLDLAVSEVNVGEARRFLGILRDLTQRKRAEDALREARAASQQRDRLADIGAIAAKIIHDIGNPLAGITMQSELLMRRLNREKAGESTLGPAQRIISACQRLSGLIREFMDFAREQRLNLREIDVSRFCDEAAAFWAPLATRSGVKLTVEVAPDAAVVTADADKLRRVLDNLIRNAVEAIDGHGQILIRAYPDDSRGLCISVADTGPGIKKGVEIFRLFETTKPSGTGLGLAVCKQIMEAHGGGITVADLVPHGAEFTLSIPKGGRPN